MLQQDDPNHARLKADILALLEHPDSQECIVSTPDASRFSKWQQDDEQFLHKLSEWQEYFLWFNKIGPLYVLQRAPSYRKVSHKILPFENWPLKKKYEIEDAMPPINEISCIECVNTVPVASCDDLEPGDHVIFCGTVYDHHGILHSKEGNTLKIIEATNTVPGLIIGVLRRGIWGKANIWITKKEFDFRITTVCVVEYKYRCTKKENCSKGRRFLS